MAIRESRLITSVKPSLRKLALEVFASPLHFQDFYGSLRAVLEMIGDVKSRPVSFRLEAGTDMRQIQILFSGADMPVDNDYGMPASFASNRTASQPSSTIGVKTIISTL